MKIKSYHILFRFFSYLSDKTNGAPLFVKYKLLLGTLIIGLTGISCNKPKSTTVTCYEVAAPPDIDNANPLPDVPNDSEPLITCYDTIVPPIEEDMITCYLQVLPPKDDLEEQTRNDVFAYESTEIPPIPAEGSLEKFVEWIGSNIQYPESMIRNEVEGRVAVDIVVDEDGNLVDIKILRSLTPEADKEAVRVLSQSRKWTPAENNGQKVKTKITLPVTFRLPEN